MLIPVYTILQGHQQQILRHHKPCFLRASSNCASRLFSIWHASQNGVSPKLSVVPLVMHAVSGKLGEAEWCHTYHAAPRLRATIGSFRGVSVPLLLQATQKLTRRLLTRTLHMGPRRQQITSKLTSGGDRRTCAHPLVRLLGSYPGSVGSYVGV